MIIRGMFGDFLRFLLVVILISICKAQVDDDVRDRTLVSAKCSYLKSDVDQHNAFIYMGDGGRRECCMCMKHTKYIGPCNFSHPNTTVCEQCEKGWDTDFQPHLEAKCEVKIHCPDSKMIYQSGARGEPTKCVCPPNMVERESDRKCVSISTPTSTVTSPLPTISTTTTSTVPSTTKRTATTQETRKRTISPKVLMTSSSKLVDRITSVAKSSTVPKSFVTENHPQTEQPKTHHVPSSDEPTRNPDDKLDTPEQGFVWPYVLGGIVLLLIIVSVPVVIYIRTRPGQSSLPDSPDKTPTSSNISVAFCHSSSNSHLLPSSHIHLSKKPEGKIGENGLIVSEEAEEQNFVRPVNNRAEIEIPANVEQCVPLMQEDDIPEVDVQQPAGVVDVHPPPVIQQLYQEAAIQQDPQEDDIRQRNTRLLQRNRKFAKEIAKNLVPPLQRKDLLPIFRSIIDGDQNGQGHETNFGDLDRQYSNDTHEYVTQLMLLAITVRGHALTPQYLLDRIRKASPKLQIAIDITEAEMQKDYMQERV